MPIAFSHFLSSAVKTGGKGGVRSLVGGVKTLFSRFSCLSSSLSFALSASAVAKIRQSRTMLHLGQSNRNRSSPSDENKTIGLRSSAPQVRQLPVTPHHTCIIITPFGMATNLCVESHSIVQRWPRWQIAGDRPDGLFYLPESLSEDRGPDAEAGRGAYPTSGRSVSLSTTLSLLMSCRRLWPIKNSEQHLTQTENWLLGGVAKTCLTPCLSQFPNSKYIILLCILHTSQL